MARLLLYKPTKQFLITQNFGENNCCIKIGGQQVVAKTSLDCPVGYESIYKKSGMIGHNGLDLGLQRGNPIFASLEGQVRFIETEPARGLGIDIVSQNEYQLSDWKRYFIKHRYWHLLSYTVSVGQIVKAGQVIGYGDNTGYSTGDHLHWEVKPMLKNQQGELYNAFQDNGYLGAIDPAFYLSQLTAFEINDWISKLRLQIALLAQQIANSLIKK